MAKTGEKLSKLLGELPKYFIEKGRVECQNDLKEKALEKLTEQLSELSPSTIDGVKIWFKDKSAILVRPSGTEPVYRLYAEAKTEEKAMQLVREYGSRLRRLIDSLKS
jgi:phosphomannomutase/phosphoglucomutase